MARKEETSGLEEDRTLVGEIATHLAERIEAGEIRAGDKLPSRAELARQFNTTQRTVTHALRSLGERRRLRHVAGQGVFLAREDESVETLTIGMIGRYANLMAQRKVQHLSAYWTPIIDSILQACQQRRLALLLIPDSDTEPLDVDRIQSFGADALISHGILLRPETVVEMRRRGMPLVVGNRGDGTLQRVGASTVDYDWAGGFRRAARIFAAKGHRRVAALCMRASDDGWRYWREQFFVAATELGLTCAAGEDFRVFIKPIESLGDNDYAEFLAAQTAALLDLPSPPTAFYYNAGWFDLRGVLEVFAARGLTLGRDVDAISLSVQGMEAQAPVSVFVEQGGALGAALVDAACTLAANPYEVIQKDVPFRFLPHPESGLTEGPEKGG